MAYSATDVLIGTATSGVSVTTGAVNGTGINTLTGSPTRGFRARFEVSSYSVATANSLSTLFQPSVQVSSDNTNWRTVASGSILTATTTARQFVEDLVFGVPSQEPYVRGVITPTQNGGTTPVCVCRMDLGDAQRAMKL